MTKVEQEAMVNSSQITPGMVLRVSGKLYRVDSAVKVTVGQGKGQPFVKVQLTDLMTEKPLQKNFKMDQTVEEVALSERQLEFLYLEGKDYLCLEVGDLELVKVPPEVIGDKVSYLKEGVEFAAIFYGDTIFSVELPQFLELMVAKVQDLEAETDSGEAAKLAILETGAEVEIPPFVEPGDVIKVDTTTNEYIQRV